MSGQYKLTKEEDRVLKNLVIKYVTSYNDDLFKDNEISFQLHSIDGEFYIQFN